MTGAWKYASFKSIVAHQSPGRSSAAASFAVSIRKWGAHKNVVFSHFRLMIGRSHNQVWREGIREMRGNRGTRRALKTVQNAPTTPVRAESQMKSWLAWRARRSGEHDMKGRRFEEPQSEGPKKPKTGDTSVEPVRAQSQTKVMACHGKGGMANMATKAWRKGIRGIRGTRRALKTVQTSQRRRSELKAR